MSSQGFLTLNSASIQQRIDLYAVPKALANQQPWLMLEPLGSKTDLPKNKGENIVWQRFEPLDVTTEELVEGVKPPPSNFRKTNISNRIKQHGKWVSVTDKMTDLHSDVKLQDIANELTKAALTTKELLTWEAIRAGTQVVYSGTATSRVTVEDVLLLDEIRAATNALANNHGDFLYGQLNAGQGEGTEPVQSSYAAVGHRDLDADLRDLDKFIESQRYGSGTKINPYEIGAVEGVRVCLTPHLTPFFGAGAAADPATRSRDGVAVDVYPLVVMAKDYFGITTLSGSGMKTKVQPAGEMVKGDELGQHGFASYLFYYCVTRLNESWGVRIETAASA